MLKLSGVALVAALAGCTSGDGGSSGDDPRAEAEDWLSDANEFESIEDHTGEDEVTVEVGTGAAGTAYSPAGIEVDAGTTVVWEWTGTGGDHDVVENDGAFESELQNEEGATFEHTFEEAGAYTYYCTPHEASGMKGAVVVV